MFVVLAALTSSPLPGGLSSPPPVCPIEPYKTPDGRLDNYHWLRLSDKEKNAKIPGKHRQKVEAYLKAENEYVEHQMKDKKVLTDTLFNEMKGRIKKDDTTVPYKYNEWYYIIRYQEGKDYPICERFQMEDDNELPKQLLLDLNQLAAGHEYYNIGGFEVSPNNQILGYSFDDVSRRKYTIRFRNIASGKIHSDEITNTDGSLVWANDNKAIFYVRKDEQTLRNYQVFRHIMGTPQNEDELIFEEYDNTFLCLISKSKSGKYLEIKSYSTLTKETRLLDLDEKNAKVEIFQERIRGHEYSIYHSDDKFYIKTNLDAENFCLMSCPIGKTNKKYWKLEIPHQNETLLQDVNVFKDFLVLTEVTQGLRNLRIIGLSADLHYYIEFSDEVYVTRTSNNYEFDAHILRYTYSSLAVPKSTYDFDMNTRTQVLVKQEEVVGGYDSDDYTTERIMAPARDGKQVPISLVYKKGLKKNGDNPTLLYGYGSYGYNVNPIFDSKKLSLLNRGFIYAIAHVRGSKTLGESWYKDGRQLKKKNTFTDFNDCAHFLIKEKYTNPEKLTAMGGSAGGLLIGAVINMEPQLYKGVVARVPFVDIISTMLDESIPLTTGEFDEWGNPKDEEYYKYMLSYSPYDNVVAKNYPHILVTTGYHDSQVQYWEPAKWVAKLRELKTDNNTLLLRTNMDFGHGGAPGRFKPLEEIALIYAFLLDLVGINH